MVSTPFDFKKFLLAGTLKNKFLIEILVPFENAHGSDDINFEASILTWCPMSLSIFLVLSSTWDTAAILDNASPLKPLEEMENKSSVFLILDVACFLKQISASSLFIPIPLSIT